jgi:hypothetical protein
MVGDTYIDTRPAIRSGITCVPVRNGMRFIWMPASFSICRARISCAEPAPKVA